MCKYILCRFCSNCDTGKGKAYNEGARWGGWLTTRPGYFTVRERQPVPIVHEVLVGLGACGDVYGKSHPHRDSYTGRPARSEFYRLG